MFIFPVLDVECGSLFSEQPFLRIEYVRYTEGISVEMKRDIGNLPCCFLSGPVNDCGSFAFQ